MRNLAESVFESTREIEDLISEIQLEIRQAVQSSEEEVKRANKGRELSHNAQDTIVSIFSSAEHMTKAAHQIELATNQQRSASGQVATAVREMAASADDVAKGAKSVLASLEDLSNLARDLQQILAHFEAQPTTASTSQASGPQKAIRSPEVEATSRQAGR
jgi:methyl-accepting chemotaxis protein